MKEKKHIVLLVFVVIAIALFVVHFIMITAYSFRDNLPYTATRISDRYSIPFFHQNWKLFAPDLARYNVELEYRYPQSPTEWSQWGDASATFGYDLKSRIETVEQGFNHLLGWQIINNFYSRDGRKQFDRIVQSREYANALFFVMKMHQVHKDEILPDSLQLRLNFRFTPPPDQAYTFQTSYLEFPVYYHKK